MKKIPGASDFTLDRCKEYLKDNPKGVNHLLAIAFELYPKKRKPRKPLVRSAVAGSRIR